LNFIFLGLEEHAHDFRVSKSHLGNLKYSIFGLGNSVYEDNYNQVRVDNQHQRAFKLQLTFSELKFHFVNFGQAAIQLNNNLQELGAHLFFPVGLGNENIIDSKTGGSFADFDDWTKKLLEFFLTGSHLQPITKPMASKSSTQKESEPRYIESSSEEEDEPNENAEKKPGATDLVDLEELGNVMTKAKRKIQQDKDDLAKGTLKEMVTPELRQALTKQGYKLIGSHSGVKLCRWTKVRYL